MAKNRYSREELLAFYSTIGLDDGPPEMLVVFDEFVTEHHLEPITLSQMTEHEEVSDQTRS